MKVSLYSVNHVSFTGKSKNNRHYIGFSRDAETDPELDHDRNPPGSYEPKQPPVTVKEEFDLKAKQASLHLRIKEAEKAYEQAKANRLAGIVKPVPKGLDKKFSDESVQLLLLKGFRNILAQVNEDLAGINRIPNGLLPRR